MTSRYVFAPQAAQDLADIWRYLENQSSTAVAGRVESVIRQRIIFLSGHSNIGYWRKDLTGDAVKFFAVYSYLIVYRPDTKPLQVVSILHGRRDVETVLRSRF